MERQGWYQVAFERDLAEELTAAAVGSAPLALLRSPDGIRAFDAVCPHRGANLACNGRVADGEFVCPFHGYRVGLGRDSADGYGAREYPALSAGGLVFVRLSEEHECGLPRLLEELSRSYQLIPGFETQVRAPAEIVIENGFDSAHFRTVHGIQNEPEFSLLAEPAGALVVEGAFEYPLPPWQRGEGGQGAVRVPYVARAFSPFLAVTHLGGNNPYWVITGATPTQDGSCIVRLSVALPRAAGDAAAAVFSHHLLHYSRAGLEQDRLLWENLSPAARPRFTRRDAAVLAFRKFCRAFCPPEAEWSDHPSTGVPGRC